MHNKNISSQVISGNHYLFAKSNTMLILSWKLLSVTRFWLILYYLSFTRFWHPLYDIVAESYFWYEYSRYVVAGLGIIYYRKYAQDAPKWPTLILTLDLKN